MYIYMYIREAIGKAVIKLNHSNSYLPIPSSDF